jgi:hypothetical protein
MVWLAKITVFWDRTFVLIGGALLVFWRSFLLYSWESSPKQLHFYLEDGSWKLFRSINDALPGIMPSYPMNVTFRSVLLNDPVNQ